MSEVKQMAMAEAYRRGILTPDQQQAMVQYYKRNPPNNARVAKIVEPLLTMVTGAIAEPVSGFVGLAGLPFGVDAASNAVRRTQEAMTFQPRTEAGQQSLQKLGGIAQGVADKVNPIAAGTVASLYDAIPFTKESASDIYEQLPKQGLSGDIGSLVADKTGSPGLATIASLYPTAMTELMGLKMGGKIPGKQYELGDISGQAFGQRGAVGGIKDTTTFYSGTYGKPSTEITPYGRARANGDENKFGGLFGSEDIDIAENYGGNIQELIVDNDKIISTGDFRNVRGEEYLEFKKHVKDIVSEKTGIRITDVEAEELLEYISGEKSINTTPPDMELSRLEELTDKYTSRMEDTADMDWEFQALKGEVSRRSGYDAVGTDDEVGGTLIVNSNNLKRAPNT